MWVPVRFCHFSARDVVGRVNCRNFAEGRDFSTYLAAIKRSLRSLKKFFRLLKTYFALDQSRCEPFLVTSVFSVLAFVANFRPAFCNLSARGGGHRAAGYNCKRGRNFSVDLQAVKRLLSPLNYFR